MLKYRYDGWSPWRNWHYGLPVPLFDNRTLQFQADGPELQLVLDAMRGNVAPSVRVLSKGVK